MSPQKLEKSALVELRWDQKPWEAQCLVEDLSRQSHAERGVGPANRWRSCQGTKSGERLASQCQERYLHSTGVYGFGKEVLRVGCAGVAASWYLSVWAQFKSKGQEEEEPQIICPTRPSHRQAHGPTWTRTTVASLRRRMYARGLVGRLVGFCFVRVYIHELLL